MPYLCALSFRLSVTLIVIGGGLAMSGCSDSCNGNIETTVLYAKPGPKGVGRSVYVNVVNKPDLGVKQSLMYEGKEFGTFEHIVIINDPTNRFASNRTICFSNFRQEAATTGGDLAEEGLPIITVE
ncbi:hypothetical protein [Hymenobacter arizonensis]|uniref:Uncharacterized protein n=1 Tax=Hymenobacter arizonensis TaxID=1227077 RepID=A0A1I5TEQ5_HYMAR|nr:hypothetical protein [Hymenobacter arizonensis]SFP81545.1 hypothetical protein SAMN04515668_0445 [Hymenobacter arizonensis]